MMKKMIIILLIILLLMVFGLNLKATWLSKPAEKNAGYSLLDTVFVTFKELAEMREPVMEKTNQALTDMMKESKNAKAQNQIDDVFFKRFSRILLVLKIIITPVEKDGANIMGPLYFGELNKFIEDIEGIKYDVQKAGSSEAIDMFSKAISHEIIDLRLYLDTKDKREKLIEEYEKQIGLEGSDATEATDQAKQLNTMRKASSINHAMTDYKTDHGVPPKQSGIYTRESLLNEALSPFYIKTLPVNDEWGGNYRVFSGKSCNGVYDGIEGCADKDILIVSYGRDGEKENWIYNPKKPDAGFYELKSDKDYEKDLVIWNGNWIRAPQIIKKDK